MNRRKFIYSALASYAILAMDRNLFGQGINRKGLNIEIGVCTGIENSILLKKFGFDYIEDSVSKFLVPNDSEEKFAENLTKLKVSGMELYSIISFLPGTLKCVGPDDNTEAILKYAETAFRRMHQTTAKYLVFGSGGSRRVPDGFDKAKAKSQFIDINKKVAVLADKYDVTIVLEPLNYTETNLMNTLEEGIDYTNEVNHPRVRLLADIYHMLKNEEPAQSIVKAGKLLKHAHIAEKENRTAPGIAGDDFRPYFSALKKINYKGRVSLECRWKDMETELPLALKTLREELGSVG